MASGPAFPTTFWTEPLTKSEIVTNTPAEVAVRVTSPEDPRTGVQFIRTFHVYADTTRIKVDQVMRNISRRQIRWGIWHLIQNDAADANDPSKPNPDLYMYIPLNPHSKYPEGYYKPYGDARHPSYEVIAGGPNAPGPLFVPGVQGGCRFQRRLVRGGQRAEEHRLGGELQILSRPGISRWSFGGTVE